MKKASDVLKLKIKACLLFYVNRYRIQMQLFKKHIEFVSHHRNPPIRKGTVLNRKKCAQISKMIIKQGADCFHYAAQTKMHSTFLRQSVFQGWAITIRLLANPPPPPTPHTPPPNTTSCLYHLVFFLFFQQERNWLWAPGRPCSHIFL